MLLFLFQQLFYYIVQEPLNISQMETSLLVDASSNGKGVIQQETYSSGHMPLRMVLMIFEITVT